ncbi:putative F-box protein At5g55150 [Carex rostrata]
MGRDWQHLPPELLQVIGKKVTSLAVYIRFRTVCHPWQSACSLRPDHLPLQLPWLMLPYPSIGNNDSTRRFYDLATSKIHELDLPETCGVSICGSSHGWLVLHKGQMLSLLNPISRATISLPPFSGPPTALGIAPGHLIGSDAENFFENWEANQYAINHTDNVMVCKAILTSSPVLDPNCKVFVLTISKWSLAFCKIGDTCWTVIEFESDWATRDIMYSNDFLYTIDLFGEITKYNVNNPSRTLLGGGPNMNLFAFHLVERVSGDILLIDEKRIFVNEVLIKTEHTVYKLRNDGEPEWIEVIDVGQNVLFLCGRYNAFSLSSANLQFSEWGSHCLCYDSVWTEQTNRQESCGSWYNHNIKLVRLDDGTFTDITGDLGSFQVKAHWQNSIWLTPSLDQLLP